jgi:hypothetical protein
MSLKDKWHIKGARENKEGDPINVFLFVTKNRQMAT